ncbi:hypothetical protein DL98DRAFT_510766 [Cadophora sp. DSE1049]|nr:hypothetical protein DL98DRAFT_510766 [Cadophora sp. DSE1049]
MLNARIPVLEFQNVSVPMLCYVLLCCASFISIIAFISLTPKENVQKVVKCSRAMLQNRENEQANSSRLERKMVVCAVYTFECRSDISKNPTGPIIYYT